MRPVRFPEECGLFVDFGGDDAPEHHQRIGDQRFEFVLARIDRDRSDERAAFADVLHDRLVVGDAAREDDGLNAAREGRGHGSDLFHDVVAHGVENLFGPLVALRDAFHDLNHGVGSQVGHQPAFARNEFQQLLFRILSREADLDQFARGDAPRAVRGERTVAVERVVDVDDTSLLVCGDRNAAAHVGHDQIRLFVHPAHPFAVELVDIFCVLAVSS